MMKKVITRMLAFAAVLLCGGAWAVTPVAVWDGNFKTATIGDITMDLQGNSVADDGSVITIKEGATQGVKFSWTNGRDGYTIIAKVRTLKANTSNAQVLVTGGADGNRTGVVLNTDGNTKGIWNNAVWFDSNHVQKQGSLTAVEDSDTFYIAARHKSSNNGLCGTYLFVDDGSGWRSVYEANGCRSNNDQTVYTAIGLGGPITANTSQFVGAAGMVIENVAIFHDHLTMEDLAPYSCRSKERAISINFANGTAANTGCIQENELADSIIGTIPATAWVNVATSAGSDGRKGSASIAHGWNNGAVEDLNNVDVAWTTTSTGFNNIKVDYHAAHKTILNGYYCRADGTYLDNSTVTVSGIPYANYDVIVYLAHQTDTALANQSVSINGSSYYGGPVDAEHPYGTYQGNNPSWGTPGELHSFSYGGNVLRVTNQTSQTATISIPAQHWIGVAAVQIVETPASTPTPGLRVVSMNFNARDSDQWASTSSRGTVGLTEGVPGCSWNNQYARKSSSFTETLDKPIMWNGAVVSTSDMKIEYGAANNYHNVGRTDVILRGYLDDGGSRANVKISNIPFKKYSVVVYCGTDTGTYFSPVTINGVPYRWGDNGIEVAPSADATTTSRWGTGNTATAQMGVNVLKLEGLYGNTVKIVGGNQANSARGGIAAVQIVEEETAEIDDEVSWSSFGESGNKNSHYTRDTATLNLPATTQTPAGTKVAISAIKFATPSGKTYQNTITVDSKQSDSKETIDFPASEGGDATYNNVVVYKFTTNPLVVEVGKDYTITIPHGSNANGNQFSTIATPNSSPININISGTQAYAAVDATIVSFPVLPDTISYTVGDPADWKSLGIGVAEKDALSFLKEIANRYTFAATFGNTSMDATPRDGTPLNVTLHSDGVLTVEMQVVNGGHKKSALVGFKVDGGLLKVRRIMSAYAPTTFNGPLMTYANGTASRTTGTTDNGSYILANVTLERITKFKDDAVEPDFLSTTTPIIRYDASAYDNFTYNENGEVQSWKDMSANNNNATPAAARSGNSDVTRYGRVEVVNGVPAFQMGDAGSCIDLGFTRKTDIRTVFWVMDIKQTQNAFFLGDVGTDQKYHFHRGGDGKYADGTHAPNEYKNGAFTCDGATVANVTSTIVPTGLHVFSVKTTGNVTASRLSQDRDQNDRNGGRAISELVVFNSELTDDQIAAMNKYLLYKWMGIETGEVSATLTEGSQNFSTITWNEGGVFANGKDVTLAVDSTTTLTIDEEAIVGSLTLTGAGALTINNAQNLTFGAVDISGFTGTINYNVDATRASFTADNALKTFIQNAANKVVFTFTGSGANGATIDYGGGELNSNPDIGGRLVFSGGTHTLQICHGNVDSGKGSLATSGTIDAPSILATNNATLTYKMKDMCGWNGEFDAGSTVKVDAGSKIKLSHNQNNDTMFMRGRIVVVPGGELEIDPTSNDNVLAIYGGNQASTDHTNAQIYVPAPAQGAANTVAKITVASGVTRTPIKFRGASAITVEEGATLDISASVKGTEAITKYGDGILRMPNRSDYTGTITVTAGYLDVGEMRDFTSLSGITVSGTGGFVIRETSAEYAKADLTVTNPNNYTIKVIRPNGPTVYDLATVVDDTTIKISGAATSFDITYTNVNAFAYKSITATANQDSRMTYNNTLNDHTTAANLKHHPYVESMTDFYRNTDQLSFAVVGTMPNTSKTTFIHMGETRTDHDGGYGLLIATGTKKDEVTVSWNHGTTVSLITTISVPNAASERHVYIVTKDDVETTSTFRVYLDGKLRKELVIDRITIIGGIQVGSDFGGLLKDLPESNANHYNQAATGLVNLIRGYDRVISQAEIDQYSIESEYPYYPPFGESSREFASDETTANWIEAEDNTSWSVKAKGATEATATYQPIAGSAVTANFAGATTVTVNVPEAGLTYENLEITGTGPAKFVKGTNSGEIKVSGKVNVYCPIVIKPGSLDISTPPVELFDTGKITFDYSEFDLSSVVKTTRITLIGSIDRADEKVIFTAPATHPYHTLTVNYDALTGYVLTITPNHEDGSRVYFNAADTYFDGALAGKVELEDGTKTVLFPNDIVVLADGKSLPAWVGKPVCAGITVETDVTLGMGETSNVDSSNVAPALDGKTITVTDDKTLTLGNTTRSWSLASVTMNGPGAVLVKGSVTATAIAGDATLKLAEGATLTVGTELAVGRVVSNVTGKSVKKEEVADNKTKYSLIDTSTEPIEPSDDPGAEPVVIEDVGTGIAVQPNAKVEIALPTGATTEQKAEIAAKITVKYGETVLTDGPNAPVSVSIADDGSVELTTTDAAKPAATAIAMSTPTEGEGEEATDKVQFTITNPIPGLFYSIVSADGPTDSDFADQTAVDSDGTQATNSESTTTAIDMPTDAKVKFFRVRVKATK